MVRTGATNLVIQDNPNGKCGGPKIRKRLRPQERTSALAGIIHGKRCGANVEVKHLADAGSKASASIFAAASRR